jgi:hypothetical protein
MKEVTRSNVLACSGYTESDSKPHQPSKANRISGRMHAQRAPDRGTDGEEGKQGSVPTNREPHNSNNDYFKLLRFGIDSLYLSYQGELFPEVQEHLTHLKQLAQHPDDDQRALAQYVIAGHIFEVKDKGSSVFPFVLEDGAFRISLSRSGKSVPMAYVKVSSRYLSSTTPREAEIHLRVILSELGVLKDSAHVSRIDLFADFVSNENMESWNREAWITRAKKITAYAMSEQFTGWTIGLGGNIACRLYNKLLEIIESGRTDLLPLWEATGRKQNESIWRLEFQYRREVLSQYDLVSLDEVISNLNGLWSYATTQWLRLTIPNKEDRTRSRWPVHSLWGYLSSVDWETDGGPLTRSFQATRIPKDKRIFALRVSSVASYMAKYGITDYEEGIKRYLINFHEHLCINGEFLGLSGEDFLLEKIRLRAREFNTILNRTEEDWSFPETDKTADAYRKASKGG